MTTYFVVSSFNNGILFGICVAILCLYPALVCAMVGLKLLAARKVKSNQIASFDLIAWTTIVTLVGEMPTRFVQGGIGVLLLCFAVPILVCLAFVLASYVQFGEKPVTVVGSRKGLGLFFLSPLVLHTLNLIVGVSNLEHLFS